MIERVNRRTLRGPRLQRGASCSARTGSRSPSRTTSGRRRASTSGAALAGHPMAIDDRAREARSITRAGERRCVVVERAPRADPDRHGMLIAGEDVTEQRAAQERVRHLAYHDPLTGLANRAKLEEHVTLALARARRHERSAAVLYIDLDRFKLVNDTLGHAAGDELLRQVADAPRRAHPRTDLLARHGGDEFMLLLGDLDGDARDTADHRRPRSAGHARAAVHARGARVRDRRQHRHRHLPRRRRTTWPTCSSAPTPPSTTPSATVAGRSASPPREQVARDRAADAHRAPAPRAGPRRVRAALPAGLPGRDRRASSRSRRCCAGTIPSAGWSRPASSSPAPRTAA